MAPITQQPAARSLSELVVDTVVRKGSISALYNLWLGWGVSVGFQDCQLRCLECELRNVK